MREIRGIQHGDTIRLYGFPGTFRVVFFDHEDSQRRSHDFLAVPSGKAQQAGFGARCESVVEVNGVLCPLLSCPIAPPAADYPHVPMFAYNDGPPELGIEATQMWAKSRA